MNKSSKTKKTFISQGALFLRRHPVLFPLVIIVFSLVMPNISLAEDNNILEQGAIFVLYGVYMFCSYLVTLSATLFLWTIDTNVFSGLLNNGAVYEIWIVVRDFLNIFFILVLLFAAFATIFQLDRYEYKKTLPMLVFMALLVNFSFPVSRVVIDLANVPMYFFAQNVFSSTDVNIVQSVLGGSQIQKIILPNITSASDATSKASLPQMLAAVVCMFLFGASFLVLAVLMLVRLIALTILVMFSPIGFVGMITPALQSFAKGWWDKLFKWAFYGPIAVMFVLVAIIVMKAGGDVQSAHAMKNLTGEQGLSTFISNMAFFAIPIILFWIAITSTEKYSNDISGLGIKWGSNLGRWGSKQMRGGSVWTAKLPMKSVDRLFGNRISGTALGVREAWRNRRGWGGKDMKERQERASMLTEGFLSDGFAGRNAAREGLIRKRVQEMVERNKKFNRSDKDIREDLNSVGTTEGDEIKRRSAALTMAERESFSGSEEFMKALVAVGDDMENIGKVIRKSPKNVMKSGKDLADALEAVGKSGKLTPSALAQAQNQLIEKASGSALVGGPGDIKRMMKSFEGDNKEELENALKARMKKEGKIKSLIDYNIDEEIGKNPGADDARRSAIIFDEYEKALKNYNAENLGSQAKLMDDDNFRRFFKQKIKQGDYKARFFHDYMRKAEGDRRPFEEFIRGRWMTDEEDIIADGGMPS